jgi:hypothetical protein
MRDHYAGLLDAHATRLPPLPPERLVERLELEAELRRMANNPESKLEPEPPPRLLPGAPRPRPSPVDRGPASADESTW